MFLYSWNEASLRVILIFEMCFRGLASSKYLYYFIGCPVLASDDSLQVCFCGNGVYRGRSIFDWRVSAEHMRFQVGNEEGLGSGEHDLLDQVNFLQCFQQPLHFQFLRKDLLGFHEILLLLRQLKAFANPEDNRKEPFDDESDTLRFRECKSSETLEMCESRVDFCRFHFLLFNLERSYVFHAAVVLFLVWLLFILRVMKYLCDYRTQKEWLLKSCSVHY